ncbi:MAG: hypothetical protein AAF288_03295 [Planctomycetota bacterium]
MPYAPQPMPWMMDPQFAGPWALGESAFEPGHGVLILGILLVITSVMMLARGRRRRHAAGHGPQKPRDRLDDLRQRREVRGDLERLMVDLEEMARRLGAQMDAKARRVEHLLDQTERRLEQLQALGRDDGRPGGAAAPREHSGGVMPGLAPESVGSAMHRALAEPAEPADASASNGAQGPADDTPVEPDPEALRQQVYALADAGAAADRIALDLGEHQGKVELILSLRGASAGSGSPDAPDTPDTGADGTGTPGAGVPGADKP